MYWPHFFLPLAAVFLLAEAAPSTPEVSVDSCYYGYGAVVLTDGRWVVLGQEQTQDYGSPDRLGNSGNTWVSAETPGGEHWIRLDWPEPVLLNRVVVWWALPEWYPRAFRVEALSDAAWVSLTGPGWLAATEQRTVVGFEARLVRALRILQHAAGGGPRALMAAQEVIADHDPAAAPKIEGARALTPTELKRLERLELEPNLARLHVAQPGASSTVAWAAGDPHPWVAPALSDGDQATPCPLPAEPWAVGCRWARAHVFDGVTLVFADLPPNPVNLTLEIANDGAWLPVTGRVRVQRDQTERRIRLTCEPVAGEEMRVHLGPNAALLSELVVHRYLPEGPHVWPSRLVDGNGLAQEMLAGGREPSYEELCQAALSMTPARALLGLRDAPSEIGVTWDGQLIGQGTLQLSFGPNEETLRDFPDTVRRRLVDGWRPATVVTGRLGDLDVRETAFVGFVSPGHLRPALFVRVELTNLSETSRQTAVHARLSTRGARAVFRDGVLVRDGRLCLCAVGVPARGEDGLLSVPLDLAPGETAKVDLVAPHGDLPLLAEADPYRGASFDAALQTFRAYWDDLLGPAMVLELPEQQLNRAYRAILTQLFINGDGDVMPYGSDPSVYSGNLYGIEEGYAMMALAYAGFTDDAARYMGATYLTSEFLAKVPEYTRYEHRHQQYRNGLQPTYAVGLYRLSRDREWIVRYTDLLRECAEWTISQRRGTMSEDAEPRPLHWGLLPKWSYGGDIADLQCYALYPNFACWRGLVETAWLMAELGDTEAAERYAREAADYRACIERAVAGNILRDRTPPFLPMQLYATGPVGDDYDQLFYGVALELNPFELDSEPLRVIMDSMEQGNLSFCYLPRFRRDVGAGGLDGLYGLGTILTKLHQDRVPEFLLGLYAYLAFNLERDTLAARETNLIYASDLHVRSSYPVPDISDPVPCSAAVLIHFLRHMLVTEEMTGPGVPTDCLRVLFGAPRAWFRDGSRFRFADAPTHFGPISCEVNSRTAEGRVEAVITPPQRNPWRELHLRLRHPEGRPMRAVSVNGQSWEQFDPERELITLLPGEAHYRVVAHY